MKTEVSAFVFFALVTASSAFRFLALLPFTANSHHMVFQPYLQELTRRGHHVTVVSFFPEANPPENYTDISLVGMETIKKENVDLRRFESGMYGLTSLLRTFTIPFALKQIGLNICKKFVSWPAVQHLFTDDLEYDAIILESFNSDCMYGIAQRLQVPVITILSQRFYPWTHTRAGSPAETYYVPLMGTTYGNRMNVWQRTFNTLSYNFLRFWYKYYVQFEEQQILEKKFGHKLLDLDELSRNTSLVLLNSHHSFMGIQPHAPGTIEVNGFHLKKRFDPLDKAFELFLESSPDGVIVFSFGSMLKSSTLSEEKQQIFIKTFAKFPQRVIWKWDGEKPKGAGPNIMFSNWIQQYELLKHPKVEAFIGHGGLLGMTEVVASSKPMLVIPMYSDQPTNAVLAEEAGFAIKLEYFDITEESLTEALTKVLSPLLRENAKKVNENWKDRPMDPMDEAIYWTERVVRKGFNDNILPHSRQMPFYQTAMLDVVVVTACIVAIAFLIINVLLKSLLRLLVRFVLARREHNKNTKEKIK